MFDMDEEEKQYNIETNTDRQANQYFIDRRGKVYKYTGDLSREIISMHNEIAEPMFPESNHPAQILMDMGWVMVGSSVYSCPVINKTPSQSQLNKLFDINPMLFQRLCIEYHGYYMNYQEYTEK